MASEQAAKHGIGIFVGILDMLTVWYAHDRLGRGRPMLRALTNKVWKDMFKLLIKLFRQSVTWFTQNLQITSNHSSMTKCSTRKMTKVGKWPME
jgi:hypothetical protein